jgi:hypothetical protein
MDDFWGVLVLLLGELSVNRMVGSGLDVGICWDDMRYGVTKTHLSRPKNDILFLFDVQAQKKNCGEGQTRARVAGPPPCW